MTLLLDYPVAFVLWINEFYTSVILTGGTLNVLLILLYDSDVIMFDVM